MSAKEKKQCMLRFYSDEFDKILTKAKNDGLNYQQVGDILFSAYLNNNKEVMRLIRNFAESKQKVGPTFELDYVEKTEIFRVLETNSPLVDLEKGSRKQNV